MLNPGGYAVIYDPEAPLWERDTFTCKHCNRVVFVPLKSDLQSEQGEKKLVVSPRRGFEEHGYCLKCDDLICQGCAKRDRCDPFERKLERLEGRQISLRSMGL